MGAAAASPLVGRDRECREIADFLDGAGSSNALVIEGAAGIGKTTLWRHGVARARSGAHLVLECTAVGGEVRMPFVGLRDLFDSVYDGVAADLPEPQRHALAVALLREDPAPVSHGPGAIAAAVLGVLRRLAGAGPVLLAIDDVQWLDAPSGAAVAFAARRVPDLRVSFLLARRPDVSGGASLGLEGAFPDGSLSRTVAGPLSLGAVQSLVHARLATTFPRPTMRRVHEAVGGNPYYALLLSRAIVSGTARVDPGAPVRLPANLLELVSARLSVLDPAVRDVLAVVAALADPTVANVVAACQQPAAADRALEAATAAGVIAREGDRVVFTHPLLSAAAYSAMDPLRLRALHARLGAVSVNAEQGARHLALAAQGPDESVARALDEAAACSYRLGAVEAAAELAAQARDLTPVAEGSEQRRRRGIVAADYHFEAGDTARAEALLAEEIRATQPGPDRAHALARSARIKLFTASPRASAAIFRSALAEVGDHDEVRAVIEEGLSWSLILLREDLGSAVEHAEVAAGLARRLGDSALLAESLTAQAVAAFLLGRGTPDVLLAPAIELEAWTDGLAIARHPRKDLANLLLWSGQLDRAREEFERLLTAARNRGDESALPMVLARLSYVHWASGTWDRAAAYAEESHEVAMRTGHETQRSIALAAKAVVASYRGQTQLARDAGGECLALVARAGTMGGGAARGALGFLELSLGQPAAADRWLRPLVNEVSPAGIGEPGDTYFLPDAVEALLALGRLGEAEALTARLEERPRLVAHGWAGATALRCRGLVVAADGDPAAGVTLLERALDSHSPAMPFERGRTLLALGTTLRRARRRSAARDALSRGQQIFADLGAPLWVARAQAELARIGGRAPASGGLTPAEYRVAELVAEGLTTSEVAATLFVSPKTVEGHLSHVYAKLGLRSRARLARLLATDSRLNTPHT